MKKELETTGKLSLNKRIVLKIVNKAVTGKNFPTCHTLPTTLPTTMTGFNVGG
jgi:hypothetical protein